jgi:hypothetical protein
MAAVTDDTNRNNNNNNQNGDVSTLAANIMPTSTNLSGGDSIEDLTHEVEMLKKKLEEERAKFNDVECILNAYYTLPKLKLCISLLFFCF